jgi:hypothetical protein
VTDALPDSLVPRLALSREEAAAAIGVSIDFLDEHVVPELRIVRRGRRKLIPVAELDKWLRMNAALALERDGSR